MNGETSGKTARQILLVDDDVAFTGFFKDFLETHRPGDWVVHMAGHYVPALECIENNTIHLVVLDISLPVMDGLQFLRLLKRKHPELPVVILTSLGTQENRDKSISYGAALFFDKTDVSDGLDKIYAALDAIALTPTGGFRGMMQRVGLPEVLQMECLGRKSSVLRVTAAGTSGRIFIEDGAIIHAEHGQVHGEPALFRLLGLAGGEFQIQPFTPPERKTIDGNWESLVMEAARLRDERTATEFVKASGAAGELSGAPAGPDREILEIVLGTESGQVLYEWQSTEAARRVQMLDRLHKVATSLAGKFHLNRPDRLEIQGQDGRMVLLLQPDRKLFMRSSVRKKKEAE